MKVDGEFVRNIHRSAVDFALVNNLIRLCRDIGVKTVAEYVETETVLTALREMGVDYVQGYLLGHPAPKMQ